MILTGNVHSLERLEVFLVEHKTMFDLLVQLYSSTYILVRCCCFLLLEKTKYEVALVPSAPNSPTVPRRRQEVYVVSKLEMVFFNVLRKGRIE